MILEVAILNVRPGQGAQFEAAFAKARRSIAAAPGCLSHELQPEAMLLYSKAGYVTIAKYGEFADDPWSVCFAKSLA